MKLEEIAKLAAVSTATASRALSGKGALSTETLQRVRRIAREFGYAPHGAARALRSGKGRLIGIVPGIAKPLYLTMFESAAIEGLGDVLSADEAEFVILRATTEDGAPRMIAERAVDGAVFLTRPHPALMRRLSSREIPCVAVNQRGLEGMDLVSPDEEEGMRLAVEHLA